ncbi:MAG: DUF1156 domain-containing protein [Myxococcota bacterium]
MTQHLKRKKLIEVSLPLEDINQASAKEKSIRHGHPSTLHLWWARRPLASCRAILFGQLVDDPSSRPDEFPTQKQQDEERERLFTIIRNFVAWKDAGNEERLYPARVEIAKSFARAQMDEDALSKAHQDKILRAQNPKHEDVLEYLQHHVPAIHDPFAGGARFLWKPKDWAFAPSQRISTPLPS